MMVLIKFWMSLTKKDSVESARYEMYKKILLLLYFTLMFQEVFFTDPDQDSEKKSDPDPGKKTPDPKDRNSALYVCF